MKNEDLLWLYEPYVFLRSAQRISIHTKRWNGFRCHADGKGFSVHIRWYKRSLKRLDRKRMLIAYRILQAEELSGDRFRTLYWNVSHDGKKELYRIDTVKRSIHLIDSE